MSIELNQSRKTTSAAPVKLTGPTLGGIFLGNIISWPDSVIERQNPGARLPRAAIVVVHRSDGSGTTSILTGYLAKVSPEWSRKAGQGLSVSWPAGIGAEGSRGVLEFVVHNPGTIGYAELNYPKEKGLSVASVQNRAGSFVPPKDGSDAEQRRALKDFIQYAITTGQDSAESLAYAKLPKSLQQHDLSLLAGLTADVKF